VRCSVFVSWCNPAKLLQASRRQTVLFHDSGRRQGTEGAGHQGKNRGFEGSGCERVALVGNIRPWLLTAGFSERKIRESKKLNGSVACSAIIFTVEAVEFRL